MRIRYTSAPLPFQGQKRMFVREFARVLEEAFLGRTLFVDLFGGSGLLSRTIKDTLPDARVIYNDFDNYADRLAHIPQTNAILADIRRMVADDPRGQKLSEATKRQVCAYLRAKERQGEFVDALTLSASLLFSGKFARDVEALCSNGMYNTVIRSDYAIADGYLDGLEVVRMDYRALHQAYMDYPGVVFVADPPYLSTDKQSYNGYWGIAECLDVLKVLEGSFVYFTSSKSEIVPLAQWIERVTGWAPMRGAQMLERRNAVNHTSGYTDVMIYRAI